MKTVIAMKECIFGIKDMWGDTFATREVVKTVFLLINMS